MENAAQFEGQVIDGQFPLRRYLGGGVRSAVFLTDFDSGQAAIRFVPHGAGQIAEQLAVWEAAAQWRHPHLVRVFAGGECRLGETDCAYVVTEYADDNLAPVLAGRHLTPLETRDMLLPVASALAYLHAQGFTHGHLKASNIMGIGERIALSSDTVVREAAGAAAADCLALGEILRHAIPSLPAPFLEIVQHATDPDDASRWTAAMIENHLRGGEIAPVRRTSPQNTEPWWRAGSPRLRFGLAAAGALLAAAAGVSWYVHVPPASAVPVPAAAVREPTPPPTTAGVVTKVLPEIPQPARDTITGRVRINVRVSVDRSGAVTEVALQPPKASKYFTDRVIAAARQWRFRPGRASRDWNLRFELFPNDTKVSASPALE